MTTDLEKALRHDRLSSYARLRGGYPIPIAGTLYWLALGVCGYFFSLHNWSLIAFITSGTIFPVALQLAKLFRNDFMKDKAATGSLLFPAFASMLLFWPMAIAAFWTEQELVPLILAIGMSIHWPAIGWTYGRNHIFTGHAIVRALAVFLIWLFVPEGRTTLLPFAVAGIYAVTVAAILIDSNMIRKRLEADGGVA